MIKIIHKIFQRIFQIARLEYQKFGYSNTIYYLPISYFFLVSCYFCVLHDGLLCLCRGPLPLIPSQCQRAINNVRMFCVRIRWQQLGDAADVAVFAACHASSRNC